MSGKRVDPKQKKEMKCVYLFKSDLEYIEREYPMTISDFIRYAVHESVKEDKIRTIESEGLL